MREFIFKPTYYEWHLIDKNSGTLLHVMADPSEDTIHDDGTDLSLDELIGFCYSDLEFADDIYGQNEEYHGLLLPQLDRLDSNEMKTASELMGQILYNYYVGEDNASDSEPLEF